MDLHNKPMASKGLTSYRYKGPYGYIMIGAKDHKDALSEAARSLSSGSPSRHNLEIWFNDRYISVAIVLDDNPYDTLNEPKSTTGA